MAGLTVFLNELAQNLVVAPAKAGAYGPLGSVFLTITSEHPPMDPACAGMTKYICRQLSLIF